MSSIIGSITNRALGALTAAGQVAELTRLSRRSLPEAPDGLTDVQAAHASEGRTEKHALAMRLIEGLKSRIDKGLPLGPDAAKPIVDALLHGKTVGIDDRKYLLEKVLTLLSGLPKGHVGDKLQDLVITLLFNDLPHPPSTYMGKKYAYRQADGGGNNPLFPDLGRAGTPYARSVAAAHPNPASSLPDASLIFDTLLKRDGNTPHPTGISSLMFAFATIIVHSLFRTGRDQNINETSSYLDLSPLYGHNQELQDKVRKKDGRGRLHEDVFAEEKMAFQPPAVSALLVVFCRNHNYIAQKILQINERGNLRDPPPSDRDKLLEQDDEIFNKARLVNCGYFMQVIVGDYLSAILGTVREGTDWYLNPLEEIRVSGHEFIPRGEGNVVSVEFNLLYRWHATSSVADEKWTEDLFRKEFPGRKWDEITPRDFGEAAHKKLKALGNDHTTWTFGGLTRGPDGRFNDDELAKFLQDATQNVGSAFKARGTPEVLRVIEIMSIEQARKWGVCTMNEFRRFVGLKAFESFEEWNSNPEIADAAERLYEHIDNLELYVGLQAEEAKPVMPGAGLCPGYTISRAILADAVSLTRGDRFLTTDFTPFNLTSWGFQDCARDPNNGAYGGMMGKLLFRTLPFNYPEGTVYAHFPFLTPETMRTNLTNIGVVNKYNFKRPVPRHHPKSVDSFHGVHQVLTDMKTFKTTYLDNMRYLTKGYGFFLAFDDPAAHKRDARLVARALYPEGAMERYANFYLEKTLELIKEKSFTLSGKSTRSVNIVRDVINLVPVHWVSNEIAGLPLKTKKTPHGLHTEQEIYQMIAVVFTFIFLNVEPVNGWALRENAMKASTALQTYIKGHLEHIASSNSLLSVRGLRDSVLHWFTGTDEQSHRFLKSLVDSGRDLDELTYNVFGLIVASVANYAQAATHVLNFYLDDERKAEREHIIKLVRDPNSDELLTGYVREALRQDPQAPGIFRDVNADVEVKEGSGVPSFHAKKGDRLFVSLTKANLDHIVFPDPAKIDPRRDSEAYSIFGRGEHTCLGDKFAEKTMPQMLRAIFSLKNVRRAPGQSGRLNRFTQDLHGTRQTLYINAKGMVSPWPSSMVIQYDP